MYTIPWKCNSNAHKCCLRKTITCEWVKFIHHCFSASFTCTNYWTPSVKIWSPPFDARRKSHKFYGRLVKHEYVTIMSIIRIEIAPSVPRLVYNNPIYAYLGSTILFIHGCSYLETCNFVAYGYFLEWCTNYILAEVCQSGTSSTVIWSRKFFSARA